jgi:hypothetical protein
MLSMMVALLRDSRIRNSQRDKAVFFIVIAPSPAPSHHASNAIQQQPKESVLPRKLRRLVSAAMNEAV